MSRPEAAGMAGKLVAMQTRLAVAMARRVDENVSVTALCEELAGELADLMAFIFKLANQHDIDMDKAMQWHLEKFISRHQDIEKGHHAMARYIACQERNLEWIKGK